MEKINNEKEPLCMEGEEYESLNSAFILVVAVACSITLFALLTGIIAVILLIIKMI